MSQAQQSIHPSPDGYELNGGLITVIIAHQDVDVIERIRESLAIDRCVKVVADCLTALELSDALKRHRPSLLLLDVDIPMAGNLKDVSVPRCTLVTFLIENIARDKVAFARLNHDLPSDGFRTTSATELIAEARRRLNLPRDRGSAGLFDVASGNVSLRKKNRIAFKSGGRIVVMPIAEIISITKAANKSQVNTNSGSYLTNISIAEFAGKPQLKDFCRITAEVLINARRVREIKTCVGDSSVVLLDDGSEFRVGTRYFGLKRMIANYWGINMKSSKGKANN